MSDSSDANQPGRARPGDFDPIGNNAFEWLDSCAKRLALLVFEVRELGPDAVVTLPQAECHALIDRLNDARTAWTLGFQPRRPE
ncbi:hypothetical protein [Mycolicibacterium vinylchloridicum]|uniref:hypothetical protein n=1 Tax=Mycolicibacterium vinylchloridicum TaxID=2736928 RepID=UPI0015CD0346|nr:hypothetical protein [Mycolicibacterium vinylchloridicum]